MGVKKKCKAWLLPTKKASKITLGLNNVLVNTNFDISHIQNRNDDFINQHLYITSDEPIKEGDWVIENNIFSKFNFGYGKKIIATTDRLLGLYDGMAEDMPNPLPQPSPQFIQAYIEAYNNGEIITDVMVEYEEIQKMIEDAAFEYSYNLKVDKNNYITITKCKKSLRDLCKVDNDLKEEIENILLNYATHLGKMNNVPDLKDHTKWIQDNI